MAPGKSGSLGNANKGSAPAPGASRSVESSSVLAKSFYTWRVVTSAPPREVFATMEQLIGTRPYSFEVVGEGEARIVEYRRRGFFGQWSRPRVGVRWVACRAVTDDVGTRVEVEASSGGGLIAKAAGRADRGPVARALQLVQLLSSVAREPRSVNRQRTIPPGPVSLVASWAGVPYRLFDEPRHDASRGAEILTATELEAVPGGNSGFVRVRLRDGAEGYVERDQIVAAPDVATREAQAETARFV